MSGFQAMQNREQPIRRDVASAEDWYATRPRIRAVVPGASREATALSLIYSREASASQPERWDAQPWMRRLFALSQLVDGWNGRGAPAPGAEAVQLGREILERADGSIVASEVRIEPDVEGGIAMYFFGGPALADGGWALQPGIFVSSGGEVTLYLRDRRASGKERFEGVDRGAIDSAVQSVVRFLASSRSASSRPGQ